MIRLLPPLALVALSGCGGSGIAPAPLPDGTGTGTGTGTAGTGTGTGSATGTGTGTGTGSTTGTATGTGTGTTGTGTGTGATGTGTGSGTGTGAGTGTGTGTGGWAHTATVDGDPSEYGIDETFPVDNGTVWITWDADALYIAVSHPDIATGGSAHWVLIYLGDGTTGSTTGVIHNTQEPALAVPATTLVRWKADDSYDSRLSWTGSTWQDSPYWLGTGGSEIAEDPIAGVVEFRLPETALGLGDTVSVHVNLIYEGAGYESSFANTPPGSFVSGSYDPDYDQAWVFDRTAPDAPASYSPLP